MRRGRFALAAVLVLAGCTAAPKPPPRPAPPPAPPTALPPPPPVMDWRDVPLTPGGWRYAQDAASSTASFALAPAAALFELRCDRLQRLVELSLHGASGGALTVTTSYSKRTLLPRAGTPDRATASLAATDRFLDEIAFSRGRFTVGSPGVATLVLPAWAEPARVIEDCRG